MNPVTSGKTLLRQLVQQVNAVTTSSRKAVQSRSSRRCWPRCAGRDQSRPRGPRQDLFEPLLEADLAADMGSFGQDALILRCRRAPRSLATSKGWPNGSTQQEADVQASPWRSLPAPASATCPSSGSTTPRSESMFSIPHRDDHRRGATMEEPMSFEEFPALPGGRPGASGAGWSVSRWERWGHPRPSCSRGGTTPGRTGTGCGPERRGLWPSGASPRSASTTTA